MTGPLGERDASSSPSSLEGLRESEEKRDIKEKTDIERKQKKILDTVRHVCLLYKARDRSINSEAYLLWHIN